MPLVIAQAQMVTAHLLVEDAPRRQMFESPATIGQPL
jgi:hypothetical protein